MALVRLRRVLGEQVALEPDRRRALHERERIGEREDDEIPRLVRSLEERTPVVDVHGDARIVVGMGRVMIGGEVEQSLVDLDGIDMLRSHGQRLGHVVAAAGPDHEHIGRRSGIGPTLIDRAIDGGVAVGLEPVRDAVDEHADALRTHDRPGGLVVRGPDHVALARLDTERAEDGEERQHHEGQLRPLLRADRPQHHDGGHRAPHDGLGTEEGERGEADDADDRTDEVELIGVEVLELGERTGHAVADAGEDDRGDDEDGREHELARRTIGLELTSEEDEIGADGLQGDRHEVHEQHERAEGQRGEAQQAERGTAGPQEPQTDAQERAEQHDVREEREVDHAATEPADQRQLHEQHQEGEDDQPDAQRPRRRPVGLGSGRFSGCDFGHRSTLRAPPQVRENPSAV